MSRKSKQKKKGMHPAAAAVLFLVSTGIAARQFFPSHVEQGFAAIGDALSSDVDPDAEGETTDGETVDAIAWKDLLAAHGSYDRAREVRLAFVQVPDLPPPAPIGESRPRPATKWDGQDPPQLALGVVMVSESARRAVLGGNVVGVGDEIAGGTVATIERGKVTVTWQGRTLTYDLSDDAPIEFRPERDRRLASKPASERANPTNPEVVK